MFVFKAKKKRILWLKGLPEYTKLELYEGKEAQMIIKRLICQLCNQMIILETSQLKKPML